MEEIDPQRFVLPGLLALLFIGAFLILVTSGGSDEPPGPVTPLVRTTTTTTVPPATTETTTSTPDLEQPAETVPDPGTVPNAVAPAPPVSPPATSPVSPPPDTTTATTTTESPGAATSYVKVQDGDTMDSISKATGVSKARLIELNPSVDPDNLPAGRLIKTTP